MNLALLSAQVRDTVVVESPLPGGINAVVRFFFHVPQWIQIGGAIVGALVALGVLVYLWRRRGAIARWFLSRSRGLRIAFASAAGLVILAAAVSGAAGWNYMQYDNGFCTGCHVMDPAFQRFTASEHDSLLCHDCHRQSMFASMRQLYLWVAERPEAIGPHAPVPNRVCEECHVTGEPEVWQRVATTAGHRTHLESDSSVLRDVLCVTCHGLEVHRFVPVDSTCAQADCHVTTEIALGEMQNQTALHCATCHAFTREVPLLATRDSAAGTLTPGREQCFSCHEMQALLAGFDPTFDPHRGSCGTCHNPHEQQTAADAGATCATADCHVDWRARPFHVGPQHVDVGTQCILCHLPHRARVDPSDCRGCHTRIAQQPGVPPSIRQRLQRTLPFDTTRALQRQTLGPAPHRPSTVGWLAPDDAVPRGKGDIPPPSGPPRAGRSLSLLAAPPDTFSHDQHADLSCLTCHETSTGHGRLTFEPPRGCQICHHQAPAASDCAQCHRAVELSAALAVTVSVAVQGRASRERPVDFLHDRHADLRCLDCHTAPVTLGVSPAAATCTDCHDDHHAAGRACVTCHAPAARDTVHAPPAEAHRGCDACHAAQTVASLFPDRPFCLTCHTADGDHHPEKECTVCHFGTSPEEYRRHLRAGP